MLKKILLGLLFILIIIQFIQPQKNNGVAETPKDIAHTVMVPDTVLGLLKTACYDCHSDHTNYPWYSKITPVNWWLSNHINDGKKHLNFSSFGNYDAKRMDKKLDEIIETVKEHAMSLESYLWIHNEAKLTDAERVMITDWAGKARSEVAQRNPVH